MQNSAYPLIAPGLTISQWHPGQTELGAKARQFCLDTIKQTYGYDYRADWHADLDTLTTGTESWYDPAHGGTFLVVQNEAGEVIGTGGIYAITCKPNLKTILGEDTYTNWDAVAGLARTYLNINYRGNGLSRTLVPMLELAAARLGYTHLNLHCEETATRLRRHWESFGFTNILNDANTSHYDKIVHNNSVKPELRLVA